MMETITSVDIVNNKTMGVAAGDGCLPPRVRFQGSFEVSCYGGFRFEARRCAGLTEVFLPE